MSEEELNYFRIFLASTSDVEEDKEIVDRVLGDINGILRIIGDNLSISTPYLRVSERGRDLHNKKTSNHVVYERFVLEESDIFICIFWEKLETPLGTQNTTENIISSVTEGEFIRAFEQREKSQNRRPVILLYRKTDDSSMIEKDDKVIRQYEKMTRFFRECEPNGKHPTAINDFKTNDFEAILRKHLLDNILKLIQGKQEETIWIEPSNRGRNHVLRLPRNEKGLWKSGGDIFFREVRLDMSWRSKMLLGVLIDADGQICSKGKLIDAGWANDNKEGVTESALREAMRRLKMELNKNRPEEEDWIKITTVYNQGYRLQTSHEISEDDIF